MAGDAALRQRKPDAATNGQASSSSAAPKVEGSSRAAMSGADAAAGRTTQRKRRDVLSGMSTIALFFALVVRRCYGCTAY